MIPREKTSTVTFFLIPVGIKGSGTITGWFKGLPRPWLRRNPIQYFANLSNMIGFAWKREQWSQQHEWIKWNSKFYFLVWLLVRGYNLKYPLVRLRIVIAAKRIHSPTKDYKDHWALLMWARIRRLFSKEARNLDSYAPSLNFQHCQLVFNIVQQHCAV